MENFGNLCASRDRIPDEKGCRLRSIVPQTVPPRALLRINLLQQLTVCHGIYHPNILFLFKKTTIILQNQE